MCSLSHNHALARQQATTKLSAKTAKQIAVESNLKYGSTIFVATVKMGEKTTIAKEFFPR